MPAHPLDVLETRSSFWATYALLDKVRARERSRNPSHIYSAQFLLQYLLPPDFRLYEIHDHVSRTLLAALIALYVAGKFITGFPISVEIWSIGKLAL